MEIEETKSELWGNLQELERILSNEENNVKLISVFAKVNPERYGCCNEYIESFHKMRGLYDQLIEKEGAVYTNIPNNDSSLDEYINFFSSLAEVKNITNQFNQEYQRFMKAREHCLNEMKKD